MDVWTKDRCQIILHQLHGFDPLCCSCWELSYELLQYHHLNDLFHVLLLCRHSPLTGVLQLLRIGEELADLMKLQRLEYKIIFK